MHAWCRGDWGPWLGPVPHGCHPHVLTRPHAPTHIHTHTHTWIVARAAPVAASHTRQVQSSAAVTTQPGLLLALALPPLLPLPPLPLLLAWPHVPLPPEVLVDGGRAQVLLPPRLLRPVGGVRKHASHKRAVCP